MILKPFPGTEPLFSISADISYRPPMLFATFRLDRNIALIKNLTTFNAAGKRKYDLWKTTCFEWFIKGKEDKQYWECNLGAEGAWNIFHLDDYRQNLREELKLNAPNYRASKTENEFILEMSIDLTPLSLNAAVSLTAQVSAVIETLDGEKSFWSLVHTQKQADFHHPDHFIINLS